MAAAIGVRGRQGGMDGGDLFFSSRPWLSLYGTHVRAVPPVGSVSHGGGGREKETALIHRALPEELLVEIYALQRCPQRVSKITLLLYVFATLHQVCYYRYMCFLPNGKVLYKTSPQVVKDVARQMQAAMHIRFPSSRVLAGGTDASSHAHDGIHLGRYSIVDDLIQAALLYPGRRATLVQLKLRLRGTCVGANNRLDVLSLITGGVGHQATPRTPKEVDLLLQQHCRHRGTARGRGEGEGGGQEGEMEGGGVGGEGEEEERDPLEVLAELDPEVPAVAHQRGTAAFVFVPFEDADTDILNLPVDKMDFYVPG
ncbi:unnamed protein product [Closterium sp. NIES-54]